MKAFIKFFVCPMEYGLRTFCRSGIFFFSLSSAFAQQGTFSTKIISFPDTSCLVCPDTFSVSVRNLDTSDYTGFVNVSVSADTIAFSLASLCSTPSVTITALDSVQITCNITFDSAYFNTGNNIIVIWSSGNGRVAADSVWTNVYLKTTGAGVGEHQNAFSFSLYPSLANNYLHVDFQKSDWSLEKIRVLDVYGREMQSLAVSKNEKKNVLDISTLANGFYFLEVGSGNRRSTRKFIKVD